MISYPNRWVWMGQQKIVTTRTFASWPKRQNAKVLEQVLRSAVLKIPDATSMAWTTSGRFFGGQVLNDLGKHGTLKWTLKWTQ